MFLFMGPFQAAFNVERRSRQRLLKDGVCQESAVTLKSLLRTLALFSDEVCACLR